METLKEWIEENIKLSITILFLVLLAIIALLFFSDNQVSELEMTEHEFLDEWMFQTENDDLEVIEKEDNMSTIIKVDIKGQVESPGVYEFKDESRILDVVEQAGGFTDLADVMQVNLAQILEDQMMIYIPEIGEVEVHEISDLIISSQSSEQEVSNGLININTADIADLTRLKGIGEAKAQNIVTYREDVGQFQTIDDIKNVSGIGDGIFESIKDEITVK